MTHEFDSSDVDMFLTGKTGRVSVLSGVAAVEINDIAESKLTHTRAYWRSTAGDRHPMVDPARPGEEVLEAIRFMVEDEFDASSAEGVGVVPVGVGVWEFVLEES